MRCARWKMNLVLAALLAVTASAVNYRQFKLLRTFPASSQQDNVLRALETQGLVTVWAKRRLLNSNGTAQVDVLSSPKAWRSVTERLALHHITYTVLIPDLESAIRNENPPLSPIEEELENRGGHRLTWHRYHQYKDIDSYLGYLAKTHNDICQTEVIGKSSEGRDLKLIKVSNGEANKPAIWIDGGLHGREWISPATVTYILLQLVEFRDQHPELLEAFDWYILPVGNPDGYEYSHTTDRLWRKTRSTWAACRGVDPNRNWDFHWGEGTVTTDNACREDFAGPHAFSEPETRAIAEFLMAHREQIKIYLTLHSYSQMWLVPWGYTNEKPKDYYDIYVLAEKGVQALQAVRGTDYLLGTSPELIYAASGGSDDWAKGVAGIKYSYTIELPDKGNYGFVLPANQIEPVGEETWAAIKAIAQQFSQMTHS